MSRIVLRPASAADLDLLSQGFGCTGRRDDPDDGPLLCWSLSVG